MFSRPRAIRRIHLRLLPRSRLLSGTDMEPPPPNPPLPPTYRQLENLDFMTAAKILFTEPPKKKKFGLDFHLVQFFFACMPSLAVYLVAQYARYEIRRMEAEVEKKKQAEEEVKAKEAELAAEEEGSELSKVIIRLDSLEETVKEIVDEKKKIAGAKSSKDQGGGNKEQALIADNDSGPKRGFTESDSISYTNKGTTSSSSSLTNVATDDNQASNNGKKESPSDKPKK